jgi:hypothetical protein
MWFHFIADLHVGPSEWPYLEIADFLRFWKIS